MDWGLLATVGITLASILAAFIGGSVALWILQKPRVSVVNRVRGSWCFVGGKEPLSIVRITATVGLRNNGAEDTTVWAEIKAADESWQEKLRYQYDSKGMEVSYKPNFQPMYPFEKCCATLK